MKVKTILTLALAATTLAACHRGKKPPRMDNSKLAISSRNRLRATGLSTDLPVWAARIQRWCCCPTEAATP